MNKQENMNVRGEVEYRAYNEQGEQIAHVRKNNLVVTLGRTAASRLIGSYTSGKQITQFGVGTGSVAPTLADTALTSQYKNNVTAVSYPDGASVLFDWALDYSEANGKNIREMGLLCTDNTLFARIATDLIAKSAGIRLVGTWKITF